MNATKLKALELKAEGISQNEIQRMMELGRGLISKWKKSDAEFLEAWNKTESNKKENNQAIRKLSKKTEQPKKAIEQTDPLDAEELKQIRELLEAREQILNIANGNSQAILNDEGSRFDKSNRKKATYNMDKDLLKDLEAYENDNGFNLSKSDIVNLAVSKYLKALGIGK